MKYLRFIWWKYIRRQDDIARAILVLGGKIERR